MKIAVVCNCYKRPEFTRLCLPMAIEHAGIDADWRLVDDGSEDRTSDILMGLARKHGFVMANIYKDNRGHYVLRNEGFEWALDLGADMVVNIDNDILFPQNWLRDFARAFSTSPFGVGSCWIVNDKTLTSMVTNNLQSALSDADLNQWVDTGGCGGAAIAHRRDVLESGCRYDESRVLFTHGDSHFNGAVMRKGFRVGVYMGVQCWHLDWIVQPDAEYQRAKLAARHFAKSGNLDGFEKSVERHRKIAIAQRVVLCE